jgi:Tfp pilus assembly protein PilZ
VSEVKVEPKATTPTYSADSFVGIKQLGPGAAQANIQVTEANAGIFSDHPLMNFKTGACFIPTEQVLPLGTLVSMTIHFDNPPYAITTRGKVAYEDAGRSSTGRGFGVTLLNLTREDRAYVEAFVKRATARKAAVAGMR